nr:hypothetical protein [Candidatus Protofrankia datiscae]
MCPGVGTTSHSDGPARSVCPASRAWSTWYRSTGWSSHADRHASACRLLITWASSRAAATAIPWTSRRRAFPPTWSLCQWVFTTSSTSVMPMPAVASASSMREVSLPNPESKITRDPSLVAITLALGKPTARKCSQPGMRRESDGTAFPLRWRRRLRPARALRPRGIQAQTPLPGRLYWDAR